MIYRDEITSLSDLGQCVAELLIFGGFGVKEDLWDLLDKALADNSFDELKETVRWWAKERET